MSADSRSERPVSVLLVDDRAENLLSLSALLEAVDGLDIVTARSGREALRLALRHDFAVVLLDVQMPDMDGYEVATLMRGAEKTRSLPIVFVTASANDELAALKGYDAGAVDYLRKPLDPDIVCSKVRVFAALARQRITITEQRAKLAKNAVELQRSARELERSNSELDQFAMVAAHDLKAPLRTIAGFLEIITDELGDSLTDDIKQMMEMTIDSAHHMHTMISSLLELARVRDEPVALQPIDWSELGQSTCDLLAIRISEQQATVRVLPSVALTASLNQMRQLMLNLLENALNYGGEGATIEIGSREEQGAEPVYFVADDGPGVPVERATQIFEPFRRLQAGGQGVGLGLALCTRIVDQHNGEIWVEPTDADGGARFCVRFPAAKRPVAVA